MYTCYEIMPLARIDTYSLWGFWSSQTFWERVVSLSGTPVCHGVNISNLGFPWNEQSKIKEYYLVLMQMW